MRTATMRAPLGPWTVIGVLAGVVVLGVAVAAAYAQPRMALVMPDSAIANTPLTATVTVAGVGRPARLVIQRRILGSSSWITVASVHTRSGAIRLPGVNLGAYSYRLAVIGADGRRLGQQTHRVLVFGQVPFSTLFSLGGNFVSTGVRGAVIGGNGDTGPGVVTTPTETFSDAFGGVAGVGNPFVSVTNNTCRSVLLEAVAARPSEDTLSNQRYAGQTATVTVVQAAHDAATTTIPFNARQSLTVPLTPGSPWSINTQRSDPSEDGFYIYVNGVAECYSAAPFVSAS